MRILFAGSGAMGARFGAMLFEKGNDVVFVDSWKKHVDTINEKGLKLIVDGEEKGVYKIPAYLPSEVTGSFDVVFVFTKAMALDRMLSDIKGVIHEKTIVVCLLNGLGHMDVLEQHIDKRNIMIGMTVWSSGLGGPGVVDAVGSGAIEIEDTPMIDEAFKREFLSTMNDAGLHLSYKTDVLQSIWHKVALNCVVNSYCTIIDCNIGSYGNLPQQTEMTKWVVDEVAEVGHAEGVNILKDVINANIQKVFAPENAGGHYPSMHQDMANHRLTEVDYLNGAIARIGKKHNIATPVCTMITALIHSMEETR